VADVANETLDRPLVAVRVIPGSGTGQEPDRGDGERQEREPDDAADDAGRARCLRRRGLTAVAVISRVHFVP
jgi:hypothetical protein